MTWTMLRVRPETRGRLAGVKRQLERARDLGHPVPFGRFDEITLDGVLTVLLNRHDRHKHRRRMAASRKQLKDTIHRIESKVILKG